MSNTPPESVAQETPQQTHQRRLLEKYGETILKAGFTALPNLLYRYQAEIGITPTEFNVIGHLWQFWWDHYPFPTLGTIAGRMGRGVRAVRVHISRLKQPQFDEEGVQTRAKLITVKERMSLARGQKSNLYDFSPLLDALEALYKRDQANSVQATPRNPLTAPPGILLPPPPESGFRGIEEDESDEEINDEYISNLRSASALNLEGEEEGRTDVHTDNKNPTVSSPSSNNSYEGLSKTNQYDGADQQTSNHSNPSKPGPGAVPAEADEQAQKLTLPLHAETVVETISRLFGDLVHVRSNYTQAANIYEPARLLGMTEEGFVESLYWARGITSAKPNVEHRMKYFFTVLRNGIDGLCTQWREDDRLAAEAQGRQGTS